MKKKWIDFLLEDRNLGLIVVRQERILDATPGVEKRWGYPPARLRKMNFVDLLHPDFLRTHPRWKEVWSLSPDNPPVEKELEAVDNRGKTFWIRAEFSTSREKDPVVCVRVMDLTRSREKMHRFSEEARKYRRLAECTTDALITYNTEFRITYASPSCRRIFGYRPEEMTGTSISAYVTEDSGRRAQLDLKEFQSRVSRDSAMDLPLREYEYIRKDGSTFWGELKRRFLFNPRGEWVGVHGVIRDISLRKETRSALLETEKKYQMLIQHSSDAIYLLVGKRFEVINETFTRMFGITQEMANAPDFNFMNLVAPRSREMVTRRSRQIQQNRMPSSKYEFTALNMKGEELEVEVSVSYIHYQGTIATQGILRDITERKRAEARLRESQERLQAVYVSSPVVIALSSVKNGRYVEVNPAFTRLTGWTSEEAVGKTAFELGIWAEPAEKQRKEMLDGIRSHGRVSNMECRFRDRHGAIKNGQLSAETVSIGGKTYLLSNVADITDYKQAQKEKKKLQQQYEQAQKLESIGQLAGGIAHDLNNLLTPLLGYSELMKKKCDLTRIGAKYLEHMQNAGERARDLVQQLLAFSRKQPMRLQRISMNEILVRFQGFLRHTLRENVEIQYKLSNTSPMIQADAGQMEQVILNLALNAQDAMPRGGRLILSTSMEKLDEEYASRHQGVLPGAYVLLEICDNGEGIEPENIKHIFEPFFSTKTKEKGTGMGLATVYGIIKQHHGHVWVYSEPSRGTTFKVYIPRVGLKEPSKIKNPSLKAVDGSGTETILLVEDDQRVREMTGEILRSHGYRVISASCGTEALSMIREKDPPPVLLLSDIVMPDMNGPELYQTILKDFSGIRVLYMSGYSNNILSGRDTGGEKIEFIAKPFTIERLVTAVRNVLDSRAQ